MAKSEDTHADLFLRSFTIEDFVTNKSCLNEYTDPHGYTRSYQDDKIGLLIENPYAQENDLALILAVSKSTIIGRLGFFAGPACYNDKKRRVLWLSGFFLRDEYRKTGAGGMMLLKALSARMPLVGCGAPVPELEKLYKLVGFSQLGPLRRFVYFYDTAVIVKRYIKNHMVASLVASVSSPALKLYYGFMASSGKSVLTYMPVQRFGEEIDALIAGEARNHFPKGSALINWVMRYSELFAFKIFRSTELLGYCLVKCLPQTAIIAHNLPSMNLGTLLDYYLIDNSVEVKRDMVLFCLDFFRQQELDVFEFQVCDETLEECCVELGMVHLGGNRIFLRPDTGENLDTTRPWFLTFGTADAILLTTQ
jgi:hypothetical protein